MEQTNVASAQSRTSGDSVKYAQAVIYVSVKLWLSGWQRGWKHHAVRCTVCTGCMWFISWTQLCVFWKYEGHILLMVSHPGWITWTSTPWNTIVTICHLTVWKFQFKTPWRRCGDIYRGRSRVHEELLKETSEWMELYKDINKYCYCCVV